MTGYYYPKEEAMQSKNFVGMILFIGDCKGSLHIFNCKNEQFFLKIDVFQPKPFSEIQGLSG
jgi:hypothetical protein